MFESSESTPGARPTNGISIHHDVIKWKHFPCYWPFVWGIQRSQVNSPHKGQWGGALMFSLICVWINGWVNNREAGDMKCHRAHCDVIVMRIRNSIKIWIYLVWIKLYRLQQNFAHITMITLLWHVGNFIVVSTVHFKTEHCIFWSNFEFDRNIVIGMGAWYCRNKCLSFH